MLGAVIAVRRGSAEQLLEFLHATCEELERLFDRSGARHIHTRLLQRGNGELRSAALQESEITLGISALQHLLRKRHSGTDAGGILVNIEGAVEMRDTEALEIELRI